MIKRKWILLIGFLLLLASVIMGYFYDEKTYTIEEPCIDGANGKVTSTNLLCEHTYHLYPFFEFYIIIGFFGTLLIIVYLIEKTFKYPREE